MIKTIEIPYGTPEWHEFRKSGIGGSEQSILHGFQDKYSSPAKLFNLKIGRIAHDSYDNEAMAWGRWLESTILDRWQYYDGENNYLDNHRDGNIIRRYRITDGFAVNDKYPWLFYSEDGHFEDGFSLSTGETIKKGLLECKTITTMSANRWEYGIPPGYIFQVHQGMLVHELDYAEIVVLKDGRFLSVYPIDRVDSICDTILKTSKAFWYDRVLPAKEAYSEYLYNERAGRTERAAEAMYLIDNLEPMPDGSDGHKDFENERWEESSLRADGDQKNRNRLILDKYLLEAEKMIKTQREYNIQMVRRDMRKQGVNALDYKDGYVRIYKRRNGVNPLVDNRMKVKVDLDAVDLGVKRLLKIINEGDWK